MSLFHKKKAELPPLPPVPSAPKTHSDLDDLDMHDPDLMLPLETKKGKAQLPQPPTPPKRKHLPPEIEKEKLKDDFQSGKEITSKKTTLPPIFIKLDRYQELIEEIESLKTSAVSLRDAVDALSDMAKELNAGVSITQKALDKFNKVVSGIDAKMLKGSGHAPSEHPLSAAELDAYVKGLYKQVENIKHDLKTVDR